MEKQTLTEIVAQKILVMIQENGYTVGDKLPTEPELVEILGAGRNTVREALRILMSRNIVTIRQGAGTFISEKNGVVDDPLGFFMIDDSRKLTEDLIQVRSIIEPSIAALAAQNATDEDIAYLEQIHQELTDLILNKQDYAEKDSEFHTQIAYCSHNLIMKNLIPIISNGINVFAKSVKETEYDQTLESHRKIFEAIKNRQSVVAQNEMAFHLMYNEARYKKEVKDE